MHRSTWKVHILKKKICSEIIKLKCKIVLMTTLRSQREIWSHQWESQLIWAIRGELYCFHCVNFYSHNLDL